MAHSASQVFNLDASIRQQAMTNYKPYITNDVQPMVKQEVIVAMYATT